jgi:hypothetical protein
VFIKIVDDGLERLLRTELPFPPSVGDISFETPSRSWSDQLRRSTINLFLFDITRSAQPNRASMRRVDQNGNAERRPPQPMIELNYLVSAWGDTAADGHHLLGEVISRIAGLDVLPPEYLSESLTSSVFLSFVEDDRHRARDIWNGAGNSLRAGFSMHATVAADSFDWAPEPALITGIQGNTSRT